MYRSEKLFKRVDRMLNDEDIYPICIPSFNRPDAPLLKILKEKNLKVILFVRQEEYEKYKKYSMFKIVKLKNVTNIGQTRNAIIRYCIKNSIPKIFMLDDDIYWCDFLIPSVTSNGKPAMRAYSVENKLPYSVHPQFFKMWMKYIEKCDPRVTMSSPGGKSDWWNIRYANSPRVYNSNSIIQCVYLNIELLSKFGINYMDSDICGIEDYAIQYHCMKAGLLTYVVKDLMYGCPTMGSNEGGCDYSKGMKETMEERIQLFLDNVVQTEDSDKFTMKIAKSMIPSVKFNWNHWRIKEEE